MRLDLRVRDRSDRPDADEDQPAEKQTEHDSAQRVAKTVNESNGASRMLRRPFKKKRAETCDDAVSRKGEERAADHRQDEIRPFQNRTEKRKHKTAAEIRSGITRDHRRAAHQLAGKAEPISTDNFKEKQHHGER